MRVAIFGLHKTGTTALYYTLKEVLPASTACYFEPRLRDLPGIFGRRLGKLAGVGRNRSVLAKFLPFYATSYPVWRAFEPFDRKILIVRDPRDRLISGLLYQIYDSTLPLRDADARRVIARLEDKQRDPASVSVLELLEMIRGRPGQTFDLDGWRKAFVAETVTLPLRWSEASPEFFQFRYEDMVEGRFAALSDFLGLELTRSAEVDPRVSRVVRTKGHGNWRHWLTPSDVALLEPMMRPFLTRHYPDADWTLAENPRIQPEHGSAYALRLIAERRQLSGFAPLPLA